MGRLDGKVCIVTGGARGQGGAEAALFRREGAEVVITDVLEEGATLAASIGATFIRHDVRSEEEWTEVARQTVERHGRVDVLINNAGIYERGKLLDTSLEQFRRIVEVNQVGVFLGMKAVAPQMMEQRSGSIVNISSIAGLLGAANAIAYGASKFAVRGMTKAAALERARHGVRVNSIHPGPVDTAMMQVVAMPEMVEAVPMKRMGTPKDIAQVALFLASDRSAWITGAEIFPDGGMKAGVS